MKKILVFLLFLTLAISSFADDPPNDYLYIEGNAIKADHLEFFMTNFGIEAVGAGYMVAETRAQAPYTFKFNIVLNMVTDDQGVSRPAQPGESQYAMRISLIDNVAQEELLFFFFYFSELEETYDYVQALFQRATVYIPPSSRTGGVLAIDTSWQNKWLYLRLSFDYPILFYILKGDGLVGGLGVYDGPFEKPLRVAPADHVVRSIPGGTVGLEVQFLPFMSLELQFQFSFGDTRSNDFINMAAGAQLKIPLKFFKSFLISPYGAFVYPIQLDSPQMGISPIFDEFPLFSVGGGVQVAVRGGSLGAFFIDASYLVSFSDAVMTNPYGELYPDPKVLHYTRSVIYLGIGYKFGFFNRK